MDVQQQPLDVSGLDAYYQSEFTKIHESNGTYKGKWNWWAFFFTWIWCLMKGCWLLGILSMIAISFAVYKYQLAPGVNFALNISTGILWSLLLGWRGTWIYYNVKVFKKQLPAL